MKIDIAATPVFWLNMQGRHGFIDILMECSANHYDWTCKRASQIGGHLYGWSNGIKYADGLCKANRREIDLTLKICENTGWTSVTNREMIREFANELRGAMMKADREINHLMWQVGS